MTGESTPSLPESVEDLLTKLGQLKNEVTRQLVDAWQADGGQVFSTDLVALGVARRTYALVDGFGELVRARNALCCGALLRLQLDTAMRFFACRLVDNPGTIALALLDDSLGKVRSRDGKPMTDCYLHHELSKQYGEWVSRVYRSTSAFVHFTGRAMLDASIQHDAETGFETVSLEGPGRVWTESEMVEMVSAFAESVNVTVDLLRSWSSTKSLGAELRATSVELKHQGEQGSGRS